MLLQVNAAVVADNDLLGGCIVCQWPFVSIARVLFLIYPPDLTQRG
jgi:hypothetical protein